MNMAVFFESMKHQQIKGSGTSWFSLIVTLTGSENEYLTYPVKGVIRFCEQGMDLSIIYAVFHRMDDEGRLGPPVTVSKPKFTFDGIR